MLWPMGAIGYRGTCKWLRGVDLNHRPLGYEPNELPGCSTPHFDNNSACSRGSNARSLGHREQFPESLTSLCAGNRGLGFAFLRRFHVAKGAPKQAVIDDFQSAAQQQWRRKSHLLHEEARY